MGNLMLLSITIWYWKLYYSYFGNINKLLDYTVRGNNTTGNEIGSLFSLLLLLFLYWKCICKIIQGVFISYKTLNVFSFAIKFFKDKKLRKTCILIRMPFVPHYQASVLFNKVCHRLLSQLTKSNIEVWPRAITRFVLIINTNISIYGNGKILVLSHSFSKPQKPVKSGLLDTFMILLKLNF